MRAFVRLLIRSFVRSFVVTQTFMFHLSSGIWHLSSVIWHLASGIWRVTDVWRVACDVYTQTGGTLCVSNEGTPHPVVAAAVCLACRTCELRSAAWTMLYRTLVAMESAAFNVTQQLRWWPRSAMQAWKRRWVLLRELVTLLQQGNRRSLGQLHWWLCL